MNDTVELDIGPLTWVKGEIELALERAGEALTRYGAGDAAALKQAHAHLHQARGALAIVGLAGVTQFADALEQLLVALEAGTASYAPAVADAAHQALAALRAYLDELVDGLPDQPLRLYPAYRALVVARGQAEPPPSDLFFPDLTQRPPRRAAEPPSLEPAALAARLKAARLGYERGLLKWLKDDAKGITEMRNSVAVIEMTQTQPAARAFWWVTLAFLDAVAAQALPVDAAVRRLGTRIDAQIRKLLDGSGTVAERLMRDVLYGVAMAKPAGEQVESVRAAYRLSSLVPTAAGTALRPTLRRVRDQLGAAMEEWNRFCTGVAAALPVFHMRADGLAAQVRELGHPALMQLADAIAAAAGQLRAAPSRHSDAVALELATALLLVESALDHFAALDAGFDHQAELVRGRVAAALAGEAPTSPELPHLDALGRRAQERLLLGQVARESLANLGVIEQALDAFFRDPARAGELAALAAPLKQVEGALAMLGQERAAAVLHEARQGIEAFSFPGYVAAQSDFEEVARKLSALGFFIEQLQNGPADIDALLSPAVAATPVAAPSVEAELLATQQMTRTLVGALREKPSDELLRSAVRQHFEMLREDALLVADTALEQQADAALAAIDAGQALSAEAVAGMAPTPPAAPPPSPETLRLAAAGGAELDAELLAIFLEEAHEVLAAIDAAYPRLRAAPAGREALGELRRSFHTLKGSGRMVGLAELGEAAWAVEQVLNGWLQQDKDATPALIEMLGVARELFHDWVAQLEAGSGAQRDTAVLTTLCERMRSGEEAAATAAPLPATVRVGALELSPEIYRLYLDEARGYVATLQGELTYAEVPQREAIRAAHTLASSSSTTGFTPLHDLAHALERALERFVAAGAVPPDAARMLFARVAGALEGMVGAVAERRLPAPETALADELEALTPAPAVTPEAPMEAERRQLRLPDELDPQLLPLFLDESQELLAAMAEALRAWRAAPAATEAATRLQRLLHTFKGSARMAGAMGLGEFVHRLESRIGGAAAQAGAPDFFDELDAAFDRIGALMEPLRNPAATPEESTAAVEPEAAPQAQLRVRADIVDRLVNEAGEMAIARSRIEGELRTLKGSLADLTENVLRLRGQLREIEIQAESRMQSRQTDAAEQAREFDPLEFDRFTRFQELTRMMAESVDDVATVQRDLLRNLDHANAALAAQARVNRELSQALLGVRMVAFHAIADRLHRVVRQTAKETGRRANLDIRGGRTEIDRAVLEHMTAPMEHLLRNAVAHGIEDGAARLAAGKPEIGEIAIDLAQEGNEIAVVVADDGRGLDLERIRTVAAQRGLLPPAALDDARQLTALIFRPGFSTAAEVSAVAGRGVGLDVVKSEIAGLGGRIEAESEPGRGVRFRIHLPLTLAVTQALLVRSGERSYAIPATMVEQASELKPADVDKLRAEGGLDWMGHRYPWAYLPRLLGDAAAPPAAPRRWVLLLKGGERRLALEIDGLLGNQEIVLKNIGPQLARIAGIAGATVLGDGEIVLILNPVALAGRPAPVPVAPPPAAPLAPAVLVVDDSLTVRKITGRLLERAGYRVLTAKDGVDALEQLREAVPAVVLTDIEMPRMDGFELVRSIRADARLARVPIVVITSRIADKHRDYAREIGVDRYLGKPYDEDELLRIVAGYVGGGAGAARA